MHIMHHIHGAPMRMARLLASDTTSHTPPEVRRARSSGAGREYFRRRRNISYDAVHSTYLILMHLCIIYMESLQRRLLACKQSTSHTPPEVRRARSSGAGREYFRQRRNISYDAVHSTYLILMHLCILICRQNRQHMDYTTKENILQ